jgi:adenine-specific DNA methylase
MEMDVHEVEQQQYLNGKALYDVSSGGPKKHGCLAITNGAVKSSDVRAAGRERSVCPSKSMTMQNMSREMEQLHHANGRLEHENREKDNALEQNKVLVDLVLVRALLL